MIAIKTKSETFFPFKWSKFFKQGLESVFKASNIFQVKILQLKSLSKFHWALFPLNEILLGGSGVHRKAQPGLGQFWHHVARASVQEARNSNRHSVQFSCSVVSDSLRPHKLQHARPPCPSPTPGVHSDSRPSSQWCHPAISSSVVNWGDVGAMLPLKHLGEHPSLPFARF